MSTPARYSIPTVYFREKLSILKQRIALLEAKESEPAERVSKEWQMEQLTEIRGLASVIHQEADQWMIAVSNDKEPPSATVVKTEDLM